MCRFSGVCVHAWEREKKRASEWMIDVEETTFFQLRCCGQKYINVDILQHFTSVLLQFPSSGEPCRRSWASSWNVCHLIHVNSGPPASFFSQTSCRDWGMKKTSALSRLPCLPHFRPYVKMLPLVWKDCFFCLTTGVILRAWKAWSVIMLHLTPTAPNFGTSTFHSNQWFFVIYVYDIYVY